MSTNIYISGSKPLFCIYIENIWDVIGQRIRSRLPLNIRDLERFVFKVFEEWNGVAQLTLRNYIASMRCRCQAVVSANGGHTRFFKNSDDIVTLLITKCDE